MYVYERDQYAESHRRGPGWGLWLLWVLATIIGSALGQFLIYTIDSVEESLHFEGVLHLSASLVAGTVAGIVLGLAQGLALLRYIKGVGLIQWLLATTIGRIGRLVVTTTLGSLVLDVIANRSAYLWCLGVAGLGPVFAWGISGAVGGFAQWLVLRRRVHHPARWILANAAGIAAAWLVAVLGTGLLTLQDNGTFTSFYSMMFTGLFGAVYGAITGLVLIDLLRHPTPEAEWQFGGRAEHRKDAPVEAPFGSELYNTQDTTKS